MGGGNSKEEGYSCRNQLPARKFKTFPLQHVLNRL